MPRKPEPKRRCIRARVAKVNRKTEASSESDYVPEMKSEISTDEIQFDSENVIDLLKDFVIAYNNIRRISVFVYSILR
jgi:hypothetical protein